MKLNITKQRLLNQMILKPTSESPHDIVEWMGAVQAQDLAMCQWAVGVRMKHPALSAVKTAMDKGEVIRTHLNRCTWQLVAAEDVRWMIELHRERNIRGLNGWCRQNEGEPSASLIQESNQLLCKTLTGKSLTFDEIAPLYQQIGISNQHQIRHLLVYAEFHGVVCSGDGQTNKRTYALLDERVPTGEHISKEEALRRLATKYFRSHAPATLADFVWWTGLTATECKKAIQQMASELTEAKIDGGIYYLHKDNIVGRMTSHCLLLPPYDELLLGYKDRSAVLDKEFVHKAHNTFGIFYPIVVGGGRVIGNWSRQTLQVELFGNQDEMPSLEKAVKHYKNYLAR